MSKPGHYLSIFLNPSLCLFPSPLSVFMCLLLYLSLSLNTNICIMTTFSEHIITVF